MKLKISSPEHRGYLESSHFLNPIRLAFSVTLGLGALGPTAALAGEKVLDVEVGTRFAPKVCNPHVNNDDSPKLTQGAYGHVHDHSEEALGHKEDKHDHGSADESHHEEDEGHCHTHPKWTTAFSYLYAHSFKEQHEETNGQLSGQIEEGDHEAHPAHRIRVQMIRAFKRVELGPSLEWGIPRENGGLHQLGLGTFIAIQPARYHELSFMGRLRFPLGKNDSPVSSWETGAFYSATLFEPFIAGVNVLAEGHKGKAHWGIGPTLGLRFGRFSVNAELALGPGEKGEGPWVHSHLVGIFYFGGAVGHSH